MSMIAEGVKTSVAVKELSDKNNIEMPIVSSMYSILYQNLDPKDAVNSLMNRDLVNERELIFSP